MPGDLRDRVQHGRQVQILDHLGIAGHMAAKDADLRAGAKDLAQPGPFLGDRHKEPPRPGLRQRACDTVDAKTIGVGLHHSGGLHARGGQPVQRLPIGGDGVEIDEQGCSCHDAGVFGRGVARVKGILTQKARSCRKGDPMARANARKALATPPRLRAPAPRKGGAAPVACRDSPGIFLQRRR